MDSLPGFPRKAVHPGTETRLTAVFEMGTGEPSPYDRPLLRNPELFIKVSLVVYITCNVIDELKDIDYFFAITLNPNGTLEFFFCM